MRSARSALVRASAARPPLPSRRASLRGEPLKGACGRPLCGGKLLRSTGWSRTRVARVFAPAGRPDQADLRGRDCVRSEYVRYTFSKFGNQFRHTCAKAFTASAQVLVTGW